MRITFQERIESLKVGSVGAMAFTLPYGLFFALHLYLSGENPIPTSFYPKIAGALLSGFLFAVTYRYVVRDDDNPHLKDGAVAAFALVRGLVPLQLSADVLTAGLESGIFLGESFVCFFIARLGIDRFLSRTGD